MKTKDSVPADIVENIIGRLPVKSLCRFKCVEKQWKALISSVQFINNHIDSSNSLHREKLILISLDKHCLYTVDLLDLVGDTVEELMATKFESLPRVYGLDSSFNGLITARLDTTTTFEEDMKVPVLLINPTTGESTKVSRAGEVLHQDHDDDEVELSGFGYDSLTDDYKSFRIIQCKFENAGGIRHVMVYSLRSNTLRKDIKPPDDYTCPVYPKAVYLNGCLHWLNLKESDSTCYIDSFNLENEEFGRIGSASFTGYVGSHSELYVVNGCLCVVKNPNDGDNDMDLWVMKKYGVSESFKKFSIRLKERAERVHPLYMLGDREVVLKVNCVEHFLFVYNLEKETEREVKISGIPTNFEIEGTCGESLVSPKYVTGLERGFEG